MAASSGTLYFKRQRSSWRFGALRSVSWRPAKRRRNPASSAEFPDPDLPSALRHRGASPRSTERLGMTSLTHLDRRGSRYCSRARNRSQPAGFRSPRTVGISSETVGWIGTAHCNVGYGAPAFILVSMRRSEEPTSELQSLMRTSYPVFCLNKQYPNQP